MISFVSLEHESWLQNPEKGLLVQSNIFFSRPTAARQKRLTVVHAKRGSDIMKFTATQRSEGTNREQIVNLCREYSFCTWSIESQVQPLTAVKAEGVYSWDAEGKRYLDFSSQLMNVNAGYGNSRIIAAIQEQAAHIAYAYPGIATEAKGRLGQLLAEITPGDLCKTLFTTGGGEANENAIKSARLYTGRHKDRACFLPYRMCRSRPGCQQPCRNAACTVLSSGTTSTPSRLWASARRNCATGCAPSTRCWTSPMRCCPASNHAEMDHA